MWAYLDFLPLFRYCSNSLFELFIFPLSASRLGGFLRFGPHAFFVFSFI
jgi:hypothetical protein